MIGEGKIYSLPEERRSPSSRDIADRQSEIILGRSVLETGTSKVLLSQRA